MQQGYSWAWIEAQVAQTIEVWEDCAALPAPGGRQYVLKEHRKREQAYDEGLRAVEREARKAPRDRAQRIRTQERTTAAFARFSATALDLGKDAVQLLTHEFLPAGTSVAQWARRFDPSLSMADIVQACRNAWTACGLQPLLGERLRITPSILGYSLLYPYSDNYLDRVEVQPNAKLRFSKRFRERLRGERLAAEDDREAALWALVELIERQYPRERYPQVFDSMLMIHRAQEESIAQLGSCGERDDSEVLRMSCAKGGSSVLADACMARGWLNQEESRFAFEWGVLLQLGDDLQDVRDDIGRGSVTLFSRAAAQGRPLDGLVKQLLNFSERVAARMDGLPQGSAMLKELLKTSWRSLIIGAVADSQQYFFREFLEDAERWSPFRFAFLRARREKLASEQGLYAMLFDAFLEAPENSDGELPWPQPGQRGVLVGESSFRRRSGVCS